MQRYAQTSSRETMRRASSRLVCYGAIPENLIFKVRAAREFCKAKYRVVNYTDMKSKDIQILVLTSNIFKKHI